VSSVLGTAVAALVAAYWVVVGTEIGPIIASVSEHHGIHAGDLLAIPFLCVAVLCLWRGLRQGQASAPTS
jgi:hypothetical protein